MIALIIAALLATPCPSPVPPGAVDYVRADLRFDPSPPPHKKKTRKTRKPPTSSARETSILLFAARHELLHDFLVETGTERPAFVDRRLTRLASIVVGPTAVDVDFLGDPIVRATVRNASSRPASVLLQADVKDRSGHGTRASTWIEALAPGTSQTVEVLCPGVKSPASVEWSSTTLDPV